MTPLHFSVAVVFKIKEFGIRIIFDSTETILFRYQRHAKTSVVNHTVSKIELFLEKSYKETDKDFPKEKREEGRRKG